MRRCEINGDPGDPEMMKNYRTVQSINLLLLLGPHHDFRRGRYDYEIHADDHFDQNDFPLASLDEKNE